MQATLDPRARRARIVATLTGPVPGPALRQLPAGVSDLRVRADLLGDPDPAELRRHFSGRLMYSLPPSAGADGTRSRHERLRRAAGRYDLVELDSETDLTPELLDAIPPGQRLVSWAGGPTSYPGLVARFSLLARTPARGYLMAPSATTWEQAMPVLRLLRSMGRDDLTAYARGPAGTWTRVLAPWLGAPMVFGDAGATAGEEGALTVRQLVEDYPLPTLAPVRRLFGIIGSNVHASLSPRLHNTAYRRLNLPNLYLPFYVSTADGLTLGAVASGLEELSLPLAGFTVTAPLKEAALSVAGVVSRAAQAAGSANALVRRDGTWQAATTDTGAIVAALRRAKVDLLGHEVAVVGCGGAGRAAAVGLVAAGAAVTLVNRSEQRGRFAAELLGLRYEPLAAFRPARYRVIVHATPVRDDLPFDVGGLSPGAAVLDLVYGARDTALINAAEERGLRVIDGREILDLEVAQQFRLLTGRTMPEAPARIRMPRRPQLVTTSEAKS